MPTANSPMESNESKLIRKVASSLSLLEKLPFAQKKGTRQIKLNVSVCREDANFIVCIHQPIRVPGQFNLATKIALFCWAIKKY